MKGLPMEALFILKARPWDKEIAGYAAKRGLKVISAGRFKCWIQACCDAGITAIRPQIRAFRFAWAGRSWNSLSRKKEPEAPALAVDYCGQFNLDRPECHSDLFFYRYSGLKGPQCQLLFHAGHDPLNEEKKDALFREGIRPVILNALAAEKEVEAEAFFPALPLRMPAGFPVLHSEGLWAWSRGADFSARVDYWEKYFQASGSKVYISCYKYDEAHIAIAEAARRTGTVMTVYQRAFEVASSPQLALCGDISFVYSRWGLGDPKDLSRASQVVVTGYLGDHRFDLCRTTAAGIRAGLMKNGAECIIGFLDENTVDDPRWLFGHGVAQKDYEVLFNKLFKYPRLGLVIKPKSPATLRRRLGEVAELMDQAVATGRCYIALDGKVHGAYTPALAALASDIVVHQHASAVTAALESALAGVPTVLLNRENFGGNLAGQLKPGRLVFSDWDSLWDVLEFSALQKGQVPGLGDWSEILPALDPFRDGRAVERLGKYLAWLLEGYKDGMTKGALMMMAAEKYAQAWGRDKVVIVEKELV